MSAVVALIGQAKRNKTTIQLTRNMSTMYIDIQSVVLWEADKL